MTSFCPKCGETVNATAAFCRACGFRLDGNGINEWAAATGPQPPLLTTAGETTATLEKIATLTPLRFWAIAVIGALLFTALVLILQIWAEFHSAGLVQKLIDKDTVTLTAIAHADDWVVRFSRI